MKVSSRSEPEPRVERLFEGTSRFEVQALLGRGANGVVYRVFDHETGRHVALKTLSALDAERLYHLKTEFRALAQIHHTNLVQLYELVQATDDCFFTMELLDGETFDVYARRLAYDSSPRALDAVAIARLKYVFLQLVYGIAALHDAGKLHRDIKPTNLFVTRDERGVIVDFGLCAELQKLERAPSPLVGTLLYMAPEQAWGKPLSPAADFYALGVVLYEALSGHPPFGQRRGSDLLYAKETAPVAPPSADPATASLFALATQLMHPDPAERPSVDEIIEALSSDVSSNQPRSLARIPLRESPSRIRLAPFVGRERELDVLRAALDDVTSGRPAVVDVQGASGIGKTELIERFLSRLEGPIDRRSAGARGEANDADAPSDEPSTPPVVVLRGRCHPQESVPYNGFDGVIDDLSEWLMSLPDERAREIVPEDSGALLALFPVLGRTRAFARDPEAARAEPFALRQRAWAALRRLLANLGERYTVALFVDDVQWGGADTGLLLAEVLAPPTPRVLLLLAYRTEDARSSVLLDVVRERAPFLLDSVHQVTLGPIGADASTKLAAHLLTGPSADARAVAERISREAQGHPLYLRELALAATGSAATDRIPSGLHALLRERVDTLTPSARNVLALVAIAGRPVSRRVVLTASGQGEQGRTEVYGMTRQRFLRESITTGGGIAIEPYHNHVREAVLGTLDEASRKQCHRALADTLLAEAEHDADALVEHLVGAGDRKAAAHFAEIAADRADKALAFDRAVQLYRRTLSLKDFESTRRLFPIRRRLANALANAGRSVEAARTYEHAAQEARYHEPVEAADLERAAAEHYLRGGHFDEGAERLRRVLVAADIPYPSSAFVASATAGTLRAKLALRGMRFVPRSASEVPERELARIDACWTAGLGLSLVDRARTAAFQTRYMLLALDAGEPSRIARGLATEASELACLGGKQRTERARRLIAEALVLSEGDGSRAAHAFNLLMAGTIEFWASRWRDTLAYCTSASELLRSNGSLSEWELLSSDMLSFVSLAYLGELRAMRVKQAEALAIARERGNVLATSCLASGPANITWLVADDPDEAERRADEGLAPWKSKTFQVAHYLDLVARVQASLYRGDAASALDRLRREWPRLLTSMTLLVQNFRVTLRYLRGRAAVALAGQTSSSRKRKNLLDMARKDVASLRGDDVAWSNALATSIEASAFVLIGDDERAVGKLDEAAVAYRQLDMHLHAVAADYERGRILGGDRGRAVLRDAESWLIERHVVSPERLVALMFPRSR